MEEYCEPDYVILLKVFSQNGIKVHKIVIKTEKNRQRSKTLYLVCVFGFGTFYENVL